MCGARHAQIIQNKKFAFSEQYLKKVVGDKVYFWTHINMKFHAIYVMILVGMNNYIKSFRNSKIAMSLQIPKKKLDEVDFFAYR